MGIDAQPMTIMIHVSLRSYSTYWLSRITYVTAKMEVSHKNATRVAGVYWVEGNGSYKAVLWWEGVRPWVLGNAERNDIDGARTS